MKKEVTFEGRINGKVFTSREAFDQYVKDLNEPIHEYVTSNVTRYVSDEDEVVENEKPKQDIENIVANMLPLDGVDVYEYIIPSINKLMLRKPSMDELEKALEEKMTWFISLMETSDLPVKGSEFESKMKEKFVERSKEIKELSDGLGDLLHKWQKHVDFISPFEINITDMMQYVSCYAGYVESILYHYFK